MSQHHETPDADDMLEEYDFSNGVRGKYVERLKGGSNIVVLDPDLTDLFPDSESVNHALRHLAQIIRKQATAEQGAFDSEKGNAHPF